MLFVFRYRARHLELQEVLEYIRDNAGNREAWDCADQGKCSHDSVTEKLGTALTEVSSYMAE